MPYSNFTLKRIKEEFNLDIVDNRDLFSTINEMEVSDYLKTTLTYNIMFLLLWRSVQRKHVPNWLFPMY